MIMSSCSFQVRGLRIVCFHEKKRKASALCSFHRLFPKGSAF